MKILKDISIYPFDKTRWVASTPQKRNFIIGEKTFLLITILNDSSNVEEACEKFNKKTNNHLSLPVFEEIAAGLAKKFGKSRDTEKTVYLSLKIELLKATVIGRIARPITSAFRPITFAIITAVSLTIVVCSLTTASLNHEATTTSQALVLSSILVWFSLFVHELGHIAACRNFGIKHGGVGVGFYFIIPVVYADITQIWTGSKLCRIITNLAGVFMEMAYAAVLCLINLYSGNPTFIFAALIISFKALLELNPFVRFDGYWLLCDITNTPNLMNRATLQLKSFFQWPPKLRRSTTSLLIFSYGVVNYTFAIAYMGYILFTHFISIVEFPRQLFLLARKAFHWELNYADLKQEMLFVILFYILIYKTLKRIIGSLIKKQLSPREL
ncbi:MAG TPA: site-2 protease family protein [Chryseolinea sp.]